MNTSWQPGDPLYPNPGPAAELPPGIRTRASRPMRWRPGGRPAPWSWLRPDGRQLAAPTLPAAPARPLRVLEVA